MKWVEWNGMRWDEIEWDDDMGWNGMSGMK